MLLERNLRERLTPAPAKARAYSRVYLIKLWLLFVDLFIVSQVFLSSRLPILRGAAVTGTAFYATLLLVITTGFLFWIHGHYSQRIPFWDETLTVIKSLGLIALIHALILALDSKANFDTWKWLASWSGVLVCMLSGRLLSKKLLLKLGWWQVPAFIVGTGSNAHDAYLSLKEASILGYDIRGFIDPSSREAEFSWATDAENELPIIPIRFFLEHMSQLNAEIFVALDQEQGSYTEEILKHFFLQGERIHIIPPLRGLPLAGMNVSNLFSSELLFLSLKNNLGRRRYRIIKRAFDIVCAGLLLMLLSPLMIWLFFRVKTDSKGPAFYGHPRIGRNGRIFSCYKFRTMVVDADQVLAELLERNENARIEWEKDFKLKNDPRITKIGRILRKYSLDELPQLWSVLIGNMSLVGPRPIVHAELERYQENVDYYLQVRPGITGLWQVSGRNDVDYSRRVAFDVWYVKNWALWFDIIVLFRTIAVVLRKKGAY